MITMKAKVSDSKELLSSFISTSCLLLPSRRSGLVGLLLLVKSKSPGVLSFDSFQCRKPDFEPHVSLFGFAVSLAPKCVHMPRLLHVSLVPLHVSRDVLALLADKNIFPAFSLPLKRHSVRHLHILG